MKKPEVTFLVPFEGRAPSVRARVRGWIKHLSLESRAFSFESNYEYGNSSRFISAFRAPVTHARIRKLTAPSLTSPLIIHRRFSFLSNGFLEEEVLRSWQGPTVYDFDDALMTRERHGLQRLWSESRTFYRCSHAADTVIAGNNHLANHLSSRKRVVVIPTCVEVNDYEKKQDYDLGRTPTAVWMGTPSTEYYLQSIRQPLLAAHKKYGLILKVISAGQRSLGELGDMAERITWTEDFSRHLLNADFAIAPLEQSENALGKCAFKILEYGATGLPVLGSAIGENATVLSLMNAPSIESNDEWFDAIEMILGVSDSQRQLMGARALEVVQRDYSFSRWSSVWRDAVGLSFVPLE